MTIVTIVRQSISNVEAGKGRGGWVVLVPLKADRRWWFRAIHHPKTLTEELQCCWGKRADNKHA